VGGVGLKSLVWVGGVFFCGVLFFGGGFFFVWLGLGGGGGGGGGGNHFHEKPARRCVTKKGSFFIGARVRPREGTVPFPLELTGDGSGERAPRAKGAFTWRGKSFGPLGTKRPEGGNVQSRQKRLSARDPRGRNVVLSLRGITREGGAEKKEKTYLAHTLAERALPQQLSQGALLFLAGDVATSIDSRPPFTKGMGIRRDCFKRSSAR